MIKFQANFRVTIYNPDNTVIIGAHEETNAKGEKIIVQDKATLTCQFNVTRGVLSDSNKATIKLYNLAPSTREKIFQDAFTFDRSKFKYVHLEAGYGDNLAMIFKGRILQAYSSRSGGSTDVITEIQAQALDIFDCQSSYMFEAGTSYREAIKTIAQDLPNVQLANLGAIEGEFKTATTFDGNTYENINKLTNGSAFVDNGNLNVIMSNEVIEVPVPVVTDDNGLLETPQRRDANLTVKMLFEPSIIVGQLLEIKSGVSPNFNGQYKVVGFTHDCTISGATAGSRITTVDLYIGPFLPEDTTNVSGTATGGAASVKGETVTPLSPKSVNPPWIMPAKGRIDGQYNENRGNRLHKGIDISVPIGTPVKAIKGGSIIFAGKADGYGYAVVIDHGKVNGINVTSEYGHISSWNVKRGQAVTQGMIIAKSGNTGTSKGPHVHLSIREGSNQPFTGTYVSPWKYVKN